MSPKPIRTVLPYSLIQSFKIELAFFSKTPPIIIYQMGKVGSNTVRNTLRASGLSNPVYSVHFLTEEGLKKHKEDYILTSNSVPLYIKTGKLLCSKIENDPERPWKIITLTREPIGRDISALFQTMERKLPEEIDENGKIRDISHVIEILHNRFKNYDESTDYACTWFDKELRQRFNIDLYDYPFDQEKGFTVIKEKNVDILVIRLEDLNRCIHTALSEFLDRKINVDMSKGNIGEDKRYAKEYNLVKDKLTLPREVCEVIYSSKYASHFYGNKINQLIHKWS